MGWDSIGFARHSLSEAASTHKLLLEGDKALSGEWERSILREVAEQMLQAQDSMSSAISERAELYNEIRMLSEALEKKASLVKHQDAYYLPDGSGAPDGDPYCLLCWERDHTLLHLIRKPSDITFCPYCRTEYQGTLTPFNMGKGPK